MRSRNQLAIAITLIVLFTVTSLQNIHPQEPVRGSDESIQNVDARGLFISNNESFLATRNILYKSNGLDAKWVGVFSLPRASKEINCLAGREDSIFIGTTRGLFRSQDKGKTWNNVFKTIAYDKNDIQCIVLPDEDKNTVIIGTRRGIFYSDDYGNTWKDISGNLRNCRIKSILSRRGDIYAGTETGLYVKRPVSRGWERLLAKSARGDGASAGEDLSNALDSIDPGERDTSVSSISASKDYIYAAYSKKIFYTRDGGLQWQDMPVLGLKGEVNHILTVTGRNRLLCGTTKGVFGYNNGMARWEELYKNAEKTLNVRKIVPDVKSSALIWALSDKGLYKFVFQDKAMAPENGQGYMISFGDVEIGLKMSGDLFKGEPNFRELQLAAIRHAEVSPEKIKRWRSECLMKALVPKLSLGFDNSRSSTQEIYTSATKDYIVMGPDDLSEGWDVSVSWDLGNLIWSDDQTNIDVRSRLMVQLRNDILDDLRRVYYERKRLKFELAQNPPKDLKSRFEKELRLEELTQAIDDLTGNYFSDHVKK